MHFHIVDGGGGGGGDVCGGGGRGLRLNPIFEN